VRPDSAESGDWTLARLIGDLFKTAALVTWQQLVWVVVFGAFLTIGGLASAASVPPATEKAQPNLLLLVGGDLLELWAVAGLVLVLLGKLESRRIGLPRVFTRSVTATLRLLVTMVVLILIAIPISLPLYVAAIIVAGLTTIPFGLAGANVAIALMAIGLIIVVSPLTLVVPIVLEERSTALTPILRVWAVGKGNFRLMALSLGGTALALFTADSILGAIFRAAAGTIGLVRGVMTFLIIAALLAVLYHWLTVDANAEEAANAATGKTGATLKASCEPMSWKG
jgi:hypothetical protein